MELEDYFKKTYVPEQEDDDEDADPPVLLLCELERCRKLVTLVSPLLPPPPIFHCID